MVNFADAISKISVSGKNIDVHNSNQVKRIVSNLFPLPKLSQSNMLKTEITVNDAVPMSAAELAGRYQTQLDNCGEWAPWSKVGQMLAAKKR